MPLSTPHLPLCAGGAGKTTLAELVFGRLQRAYPPKRAVFLRLVAGERVDAAPYVEKALEALGVQPMPGDVLHHKGQLRDLAAREPLLLVADNVWSAAQMEALLPPQLARGSRVMMTARAADFGQSVRLQYQVMRAGLLCRHRLCAACMCWLARAVSCPPS